MNEPRRILHLIGRLDGYGGARMLRYLAACQAEAGDLTIVAAFTADDEVAEALKRQGVTVHVLGGRWPVDVVAIGRLVRLRRRTSADVIHTWDVVSLVQTALTNPRTLDSALLATLDTAPLGKQWSQRAVRSLWSRAKVFVSPDEVTQSWLKCCGVAEDRLRLIPPSVPTPATPTQSRSQARAELALPEEAQVIAIAGPLRRQKQVAEAIWCFELVRVLHENARLLIFGDGPDRERLERFAEEVSDPGCVRFLDYRSDIAELLPAADVFWQLDAPATTPLALLEAQAAGVPVVASDVPAHRAAVSAGDTGLFAPLGVRAEVARATDELLNNSELAHRLGTAATESVAQRWSCETAIASYQQLYDQLLMSNDDPRNAGFKPKRP